MAVGPVLGVTLLVVIFVCSITACFVGSRALLVLSGCSLLGVAPSGTIDCEPVGCVGGPGHLAEVIEGAGGGSISVYGPTRSEVVLLWLALIHNPPVLGSPHRVVEVATHAWGRLA